MPLDSAATPPFARPQPAPDVLKGLVAAKGGAQHARDLARSDFETSNRGVHLQQEVVDHEDHRFKRQMRELRYAVWRCGLEEPRLRLLTREVAKQIPFFDYLKAFLMLIGSLAALWIGNKIGGRYVLGSGSDLYATDPDGAQLFMGVVLLAAIALKAVEAFICSGLGKKIYVFSILVMSLPGVLVWIAAFAMVFTPDPSGGVSRMVSGDQHGPAMMALMIFLHLMADLGLGYLCFAGAEKVLLAGRKPDAIDNEEYLYWQSRILALENEIWLTRKTRALSLDELESRQHALRCSEIEAELTHERTKTVLESRAESSIHAARADALK